MSKSDRCVHARLVNGSEIVRYDRAGKWYVEGDVDRRKTTVTGAARLAAQEGAVVLYSLPGGSRFEAKVRVMRAQKRGEA